jgi:hypothetical protein
MDEPAQAGFVCVAPAFRLRGGGEIRLVFPLGDGDLDEEFGAFAWGGDAV